MVDAFAAEGALAHDFALAELGASFPAGLAVSFHLVDYVVHTWDVAASLGIPVEFSADLLAAALEVAAQVPDGSSRLREGASFAPGLDVAADAPVLDRVLSLLGRSPRWSPAG